MASKSQPTVREMKASILATKKKATPDYGGNVLPAIELYRGLTSSEERKNFQDALELMLRDENHDTREYAITLCLGFFVLRDAF